MGDKGSDDFVLAQFLNDNSGLFVVMGIFSALAVYLTNIAEASDDVEGFAVNIGVVASFFVFLLLIGLTINEMAKEFGDRKEFIDEVQFYNNFPLFTFIVILLMIVITMIVILQNFNSATLLLLYGLEFSAIFSIFLFMVSWVSQRVEGVLKSQFGAFLISLSITIILAIVIDTNFYGPTGITADEFQLLNPNHFYRMVIMNSAPLGFIIFVLGSAGLFLSMIVDLTRLAAGRIGEVFKGTIIK